MLLLPCWQASNSKCSFEAFECRDLWTRSLVKRPNTSTSHTMSQRTLRRVFLPHRKPSSSGGIL
ncbi:uncharacterized protein BO88DRAFT_400903 [Aspergillus vadensis CBS 113365]|uniref:Uncharacterized protein n=1 Tax=Aspergillus vadensis (strain CBS 113365 / IMI 142717 / IBT 24658) TaxID=1448311 RepID=A0A319BJA9_ASPVC|nr:hypothetical protein BO88DRAFT_400903 [Aspergillus vadensis CBS 113365]PYH73266.1 hypothetical protein BO88DRAFT_400903 [Aspergillus vadensis CBS 113365]